VVFRARLWRANVEARTYVAGACVAICARLTWLGAKISSEAKERNAPLIGAADSRIEIRIIPTDEEAMIARHCLAFI
jgi:acetate kinase